MLETFLLALALSADAFAISLAIAGADRHVAARFRVATVFGGFQFLFALTGWQTGARLLHLISPWDRYVGAAVLAVIAGKMLWESFEDGEPSAARENNPTRGWPLILLGIADSIDALAAGVTLDKLPPPEIVTCIVIGAVTFGISWAGMSLAQRIAKFAGRWAERGGALVLAGIAVKIAIF